MNEPQDHELGRLIEQRDTLRRQSNTLPALGAEAHRLGAHAQALHNRWRSEQSAVEWRERFGTIAQFAEWFGGGRLEEKRQEANRLLLEYKTAEARHKSAVQKLESAETDEARLPRIEKEVASLIAEREERWKQSGSEVAAQIQSFQATEAGLRARMALLGDALVAAESASASLDYAIARLTSAQSWGRYDILAGGAMASWAKRTRMDQASQAASSAGIHLRRFHDALEKLGKVAVIPGVDVQIGSLFFDVFFDNIFTDLSVQGRIRDGLDRLQRARSKVAECHQNLDADANKTEAGLRETVQKREAFVLSLG